MCATTYDTLEMCTTGSILHDIDVHVTVTSDVGVSGPSSKNSNVEWPTDVTCVIALGNIATDIIITNCSN